MNTNESPLSANTKSNGFVPVLFGALLIGASFAALRVGDLPVNFQIDGQVPEYLAWAAAPETLGKSLNAEMNGYLYSVYYAGLGMFAQVIDRAMLLKIMFVAEILAVCAAVCFLAMTLTRNRWAAWIAVTIVAWNSGMAVAPGGSTQMGLICGAMYPAIAMALVALAFSWRRKHILAAILAGLAFNIHGSIALFASIMVLAAAFSSAGWRIRRQSFGPALACLAAASPTLIWMLSNPPPAASISTQDWLRFPSWVYVNHIFASATPLRIWLMLFVFITPGIIGMAAKTKSWRPNTAILTGWIGGTAFLLLIGYIFVELIPVRPVAQLTLWRGTLFLIVVLLVFGMAHLVDCLRKRGFTAVAAAMTLTAFMAPVLPELAWIGHLGLAALLAIAIAQTTGLPRMLAGLAMLCMGGVIFYDTTLFHRIGDHLTWRWPVAILALAALFVWSGRSSTWLRDCLSVTGMIALAIWLVQLDVGQPFSSHARRRAAAVLDFAQTIESRSEPGQLVIAPPDIRNPGAWANRGSFLCRQQMTAYAYAPWLAEKIMDRVAWYLNEPVDDFPTDKALVPHMAECYRSRTSDDFGRLRDQYGVRLAIVENDQPLSFQAVAINDSFTLYDLEKPLGRAVTVAAGPSTD